MEERRITGKAYHVNDVCGRDVGVGGGVYIIRLLIKCSDDDLGPRRSRGLQYSTSAIRKSLHGLLHTNLYLDTAQIQPHHLHPPCVYQTSFTWYRCHRPFPLFAALPRITYMYSWEFSLSANFRDFCGQTCFRRVQKPRKNGNWWCHYCVRRYKLVPVNEMIL